MADPIPSDTAEIPFSDDETVNDDQLIVEDDSPDASFAERAERKKKRSERIKKMLDEGTQSRERATRLEAELAGLKGEMERMKGALSVRQAPPQTPGKDPYEARLDAVYAKQNEAYIAAQAEVKANTFTAERAKHYERIAREVETEKSAIHAERAIASTLPALRQDQVRTGWANRYPEVYNNPRAFQFAKATFERRTAMGDYPSNDLTEEVLKETMATFRLGKRAAPSASEKAALSGMPSSGGGGGGSSGVHMTPELRSIAIAANPGMREEDAVKHWVNTVGKKMREKRML